MKTYALSEQLRFFSRVKMTMIAPFLLFICLSSWSLSAPINSGLDPTFHLANIWCGWGESAGKCEEMREVNSGFVARIPNQLHGIDNTNLSDQDIAQPDARSPFYTIMRVFVSNNVTASTLIMRLFQSLITSLMFWSLLHFSKSKMRTAIVSAWTFTVVPIVISTVSQTTPRSWAYLSGMSSWAFLMLALERKKNRQPSSKLWILYSFSVFLAISSRWDATLFVAFSSALILAIHFLKEAKIAIRTFVWITVGGASLLIIARMIFPRLASYTTFNFGSTFTSGKTIFQLIHLPENVADGLGLGVRLVDLGPNLIGIIGVMLFAYALSRSLTNSNIFQVLSVVSIAVFIFLAMYRITLNWPEQIGPSGVYVVQLLTVMLGLSIALSDHDQDFLLKVSHRTMFISLLTITHALALFSRMEWAVRPNNELNDTYFNLSLNGGWWWNSPIGPNVVYLMGALAFPAWLIVSWNVAADKR
jgi:hypothetical protein